MVTRSQFLQMRSPRVVTASLSIASAPVKRTGSLGNPIGRTGVR
jgi:hypothetical protein